MEWIGVDEVATALELSLSSGILAYVVTAFFVARSDGRRQRESDVPVLFTWLVMLAMAGAIRDFDADGFFVLLAVFMALPFVMVFAVANLVVFVCFLVHVPHRPRLAAAVAVAGTLVVTALFLNLRGNPIREITRTEPFGVLAVGWAVVLLIAGTTVPPIRAVLHIVSSLRQRRVVRAAQYALVVALGLAMFVGGERLSDVLVVNTIGSEMQRKIHEARRGVVFPPMSQTEPFMITPDHELAIYLMGGPLFRAEFIAYDALDSDAESVSRKIGKTLNGNNCWTSARPIGQHYYFVAESC